MRILVTGGAGFIGSNFVRHVLAARPHARVVNFDLLTYAGNLRNLEGVDQDPRYRFIRGDIADAAAVHEAVRGCDVVVNFAAESHVDRSILDPAEFVRTNVVGTQNLLQAARAAQASLFVQVSTDEVYGSLGETGSFTESTPLDPSSPYSASKAAADLMVQAAHKTFGLATVITRCSNNYGPFQFPEKLIPLMITNALESQPLPVYGDGLYRRDWLHVEDHCRALDRVIEAGAPGEVYNVGGGGGERTNLFIVREILKLLGRPESLIRHVQDRPAHDRRYAVDSSKLRNELDWEPRYSLEEGLRATVEWYRTNEGWWREVKSGEYRNYYERQYGARLAP
jgi:dTDP-glucose 4,6-dehydratase